MILRVIPLVLSSWLLGAHFFRAGNIAVAVFCVILPLTLLIGIKAIRQRWAWIVLQLYAYAGSVVWIIAAIEGAQLRMMHGAPWIRLVLILGGVALFTLISGLLLNTKPVKEKYLKA